MRIKLIFTIFFVFLLASANSEMGYSDYESLRQDAIRRMNEKDFKGAAELFARYGNDFPDKAYSVHFNIAYLYLSAGEDSLALKALKDGVDKGLVFPLMRSAGLFSVLEKYEGFGYVYEKNESLRAEASKNSSPLLTMADSCGESLKHPLFIALHGGGENNEIFMKEWTSKKLLENFHVAYIQSSQVFSEGRFWWENLETGMKDIDEILSGIESEGKYGHKDIYLGGFSHGGRMALYYAFKTEWKVKKLFMLCPEIEADIFLNEALSAKFKKEKTEIVLITGSDDPSIMQQRAFRDFAKKKGIKLKYVEMDGMGHMFSDEFYRVLEENI